GLVVVLTLGGCAPARGEPATSGPSEARTAASSPSRGPSPGDDSGDPRAALRSCFAAAYKDANVDDAVSRCEEKQFRTRWREEVRSSAHEAEQPEDGGSRPDAGTYRGKLAPELIQESVRARFNVFRACYASGLRRNAKLRGKVAVMFSIDAFGH